MDEQGEYIRNLINQAWESKLENLEYAVSCAKKAVEESEERYALHWFARYAYHFMKICSDDRTVDFEQEYRELLKLWKEYQDNSAALYVEGSDSVSAAELGLHYILSVAFFLKNPEDCLKIAEYERIVKHYYFLVNEHPEYFFEAGTALESSEEIHFIWSNFCLGNIYYMKDNPLAAISYYEKILDRVQMKDVINQPVYWVLSMLCSAYMNLGESEKARKMVQFLYDSYREGRTSGLGQKDIQRVILLIVREYVSGGILRQAWKIIRQSFDEGMIFHISVDDFMWEIYLNYLDLSNELMIPVEDFVMEQIDRLVKEREDPACFTKLSLTARAELYCQKSLLLQKRNEKKWAEKCMRRAVSLLLDSPVRQDDRRTYMIVMARAFEFFAGIGKDHQMERGASHIMRQLPVFLFSAESLLDNVQMEKYLLPYISLFKWAYSFFSEYVSASVMESDKNIGVSELFEYSANFKSIFLPVIRERAKRTYHRPYFQSFLKKRNDLRDQAALGKNGNRKKIIADESMLLEKIEKMEKEFASRYEQDGQIPFYSFEQFMASLPEDTIFIEMHYVSHDGWKQPKLNLKTEHNEEEEGLDIFFLAKGEDMKYTHLCKEEMAELDRKIKLFREKAWSQHGKYEKLAGKICNALFGAFRDLFKSVSDVIISPDRELYNIPFDLVFETAWEEMQGKRFVYCQSARNLQEQTEKCTAGRSGMCMIGFPKYDLEVWKGDSERMRGKAFLGSVEVKRPRCFDLEQVKSLPFSEYEIMAAAEIMGGDIYIGKDATKYSMRSGYQGYHIATHGMVQKYGERNSWYNSGLIFAGACNWYKSGISVTRYGNGILTAEEISRMDLSGTLFVVLSACDSAVSNFSLYEQQSGLHIAFGAAGVKYVISAINPVEDMATALLMRLFYQELSGDMDVPGALGVAKKKFRDMNVRELKKLVKSDRRLFGEEQYGKIMGYLSELPEAAKLYQSPKYYAAFVCYQYRF